MEEERKAGKETDRGTIRQIDRHGYSHGLRRKKKV